MHIDCATAGEYDLAAGVQTESDSGFFCGGKGPEEPVVDKSSTHSGTGIADGEGWFAAGCITGVDRE